MKGKAVILVAIICFVLTLGTIPVAKADTVLFPVIAVNYPYVTTIVSVTNQGPTSGYLKYTYFYKPAFVGGLPNYSGECSIYSRVRPTWSPDVVSFDASGSFNGGWALFNDADNYGGPFDLPVSGAYRGYLLVTNSDAAGNRVNVGSIASLRGEAIVMDIFAGAAWGYRAVNNESREDYDFWGMAGAIPSGSTFRFSFFPLNEWTTRFFVTPVDWGMNLLPTWTSTIKLYQASPVVGGIYGRAWDTYAFNVTQVVRCTAGVNLVDLLDATAYSNLWSTGGWGRIGISSGHSAYIYKLEYVVNNPTYGGTNNNAYQLNPAD
ncbi:MAG: hypothetical protein FJ242_00870 [Nitrospira sp.]|nr:hypothetical protein [Nitrospira sp.]